MKHLTIQECRQRGNVVRDPNDRSQVVLYQCINVQPEFNTFNCKPITFQRTLLPLADCSTPFFVMQRNGSVGPEIGMFSRLHSRRRVRTAACVVIRLGVSFSYLVCFIELHFPPFRSSGRLVLRRLSIRLSCRLSRFPAGKSLDES